VLSTTGSDFAFFPFSLSLAAGVAYTVADISNPAMTVQIVRFILTSPRPGCVSVARPQGICPERATK
jgi:hypothetical protein